jgi:hypothetical protein
VVNTGYQGGGSIHPVMSEVERSGLARTVLEPALAETGVERATPALLRVAAWSMLQDDASQAPYGWSHCLTLPQAALGVAHDSADAVAAIAIAATQVLGFRNALGRVVVDPAWAPERPAPGTHRERLDGTPAEAAAAMWHASDVELPGFVTLLATRAATHADAHLAKYTLACIDAASADPEARRTYFAAAAFLNAWWRQKTPEAVDELA